MTVIWDFGDGATATKPFDQAVTHTYAEPGTFRVTATDDEGHRLATEVSPTRLARNLLPNDDAATFANSNGGWSAIEGSTLSRASGTARHGDTALRVSRFTVIAAETSAISPACPVVAGQRYTMLYSLLPVDPPDDFEFESCIWWQDDDGETLAEVSVPTGARTGEWTDGAFEATAAPGATAAVLDVRCFGSWVPPQQYLIDRTGLFAGSVTPDQWTLPSQGQSAP